MSTHLSTASPVIASPGADATGNSAHSAALRSWATLNVDPEVLDRRDPEPTAPTLVHLSRLIEPDLDPHIDLTVADNDVIDLRTDPTPTGSREGSSLGRPLFQIGLAALVAALAVGFYTFSPTPSHSVSSVDPLPTDGGAEPATGLSSSGSSAQLVAAPDPMLALDLPGAQQANASEADLSIVGTATSDGEHIRWTATVRNQGPGVANQPVRVIQTLPADLEYVSSVGSDWSCTFNSGGSTVTCDLQQDLSVGQRRQLGVVTTDGNAGAGDKLPATMAIVGSNADNDLSNNTINVVAVVAESSESRSSSARSTGPTTTDDDSSATDTAADSGTTDDGVVELPKTGAGLTVFLALIGTVMCLTGRRLLQASADHGPIPIELRLGG